MNVAVRLAFAVAVSVSGCGLVPSVPSNTLATSSLRAFYKVEVSTIAPAQTRLNAGFYSGASPVELAAGDTLAASTDKDPNVALSPMMGMYTAQIPAVDRTQFTFQLTRANGPAAKSTVTIPALMTISSPAAGHTLSHASGNAVITWSNPTPGARVHAFAGPCSGIQVGDTAEVDDTGTYTLPMSKVIIGAAPTAPTCTRLYVIRKMTGTTDPGFAAGSKFETASTVTVEVLVGP
jgi:hypothetical protein